MWGPATGGTIYPDLQPTVDQFNEGQIINGQGFGHPGHANPSSVILPDHSTMIDAGTSPGDSSAIYESMSVPEHSMPRGISPTQSNRSQPTGRPNMASPQQPTPAVSGQPLTSNGKSSEIQWQSPPSGLTPANSGSNPPTITGPALNPYTQSAVQSGSNQVSWMQTANASQAIDFASASSDRPQRLGAVDTSAKQGTEMEQAQSSRGDTSYPVQTIPSISPQTWIR